MATTLDGGSIGEQAGGSRIGRLDLVLAIACLSILAVVALPNHRVATAETRSMETAALAASLTSAAALGHSLWRARGAPGKLDIERNGTMVRVAMVNGYPSAASLPLLLEEPETNGFSQVGASWRHGGTATCAVTYAPPRWMGNRPEISTDTSGC